MRNSLTAQLLNCLVETLNSRGIVYCHWKSNLYLRDALAKGRDLDLLVTRQDARQFENVLMSLDFKRVTDPLQVRLPSVIHYYGLDHTTNELVHLHVFYHIITGESLIKNHCFPLEDSLMYERLSFVSATNLRIRIALKSMWRRLRHAGKSKQFASGGRLIAFVGPEATGKSTLVKETVSWLGQAFDVSSAHLGKPPSTWLTFLPNLALPLLRCLVPQHRISMTARDAGRSNSRGASLLVGLRAVLIAWDRRALVTKLRRRSANGGIVVCDRYPSTIPGAMDSPRLEVPFGTGWQSKLLGFLAKLESHIYCRIPPPDLVIRLTVPVEVAIARNREREAKREAEDYVLRRHTAGVIPSFPTARTIELDTSQTLPQTIHCARRIVWDAL